MQNLSAILEKISRFKTRNQTLFSPLLDIPESDLMPYDVSESGLTRSDVHDKIRKIHSCASLLEFRTTYKPDKSGVIEQGFRIHNATYCRHYTVCEICARRVQMNRWKRFRDPVENLTKKYPYVYHVTFTIEDKANLGERIDFLQQAFRNFVRFGQKRKGKKGSGEWGKVGAAIVATETKRGDSSDLWHAHKHALVFCNEPLNFRVYDQEKIKKLEKKYGFRNVPKSEMLSAALQTISRNGEEIAVSKLSGEWLAATAGQGISIHARRLRGNVASVAKEVLKYPVKVSLKNKLDIPYMIEQTYNRRFLSTFGDLRHLGEDSFTDPETENSKEIYLSRWTGYKYSDLVPGRPIACIPDEVRKIMMSRIAVVVGNSRKQRRNTLSSYPEMKIKILANLADSLNAIKQNLRNEVASIVKHFSMMPELSTRALRCFPVRGLPDAEQLSLDFAPA